MVEGVDGSAQAAAVRAQLPENIDVILPLDPVPAQLIERGQRVVFGINRNLMRPEPRDIGRNAPAVASISRRSIWLTLLKSTRMRSWLALKSSTTARIASASNPVHFSQYLITTFPEPGDSLLTQPLVASSQTTNKPDKGLKKCMVFERLEIEPRRVIKSSFILLEI